ncbi:MAG: chitobiase/beta-hexosaminidase C-terminal domain-containing protein [Prevotella sp.]|nr:chitobiase/beta-hexosaminidase C-terminal domain-containing protein [Prevotella sp.]
MNSIVQKFKSLVVLISLLFLTGGIGAWAQTDYSGKYYIASRDYVAGKTATNFYLCPTEDWYYYNSDSPYYTGEDNGMPFMTTYQCRNSATEYDSSKAEWIIKKKEGTNYYTIKRAIDGKYLTYNVAMGENSNAGRMRVHLEAEPTDENDALFEITYNSGSSCYEIKTTKEATRKYLNVTGPSGKSGNINSLQATKDRADGPTGMAVGGIIGLYTSGASDSNSRWYLENAIVPPTITNNNDGTFTITAPEGTIYYTTDGSTPTTTESTETKKYTRAITLTAGMTAIKAIAVVDENASEVSNMPLHTYTYYIINRAGNIAIKKAVKQGEGKSLSSVDDIPADIRSSYLADESATFYSFSGPYSEDKLDVENKITVTPSADVNIYVTYTTTHLSEKFLRLRGVRALNIKNLSDKCAYDNNGSLVYDEDDTKNAQPSHMWNMGGTEDPYDVEIKNIGTGKYMVFSSAPTLAIADAATKFIIMAGSDPGDLSTYEQINLMAAATGNGDTDFSKAEVRVYPVEISVTYKLIDRQKKLIATITSNDNELKLPDEWISPLVSAYHFYKTASIVGDVYTLSDPITSTFDVESGNPIYVNYEVSDDIDLDGMNSLNIEDKENKTYMLRFLDGIDFNQENGSDGISDVQTKAVYPYNNGDVTLYVYGAEQWQTQLAKGASTRSRWLWYIVPANNPASKYELDPYHVNIVSYQNHIFKDKYGNELGRYHSYLRTYKPEGYANVVTSVINSNPLTKGRNYGDAPYTDLATEYMIVGTAHQTRLVTLNPIDDGTSNKRRTVNSFEQYWKNRPTVQGILSEANKVTTEGRNVTLTSAQKTEIAEEGWHVYTAWAYSAPWINNKSGTTETNKQYLNEEHAFQTISMGSGNFVFEEVSLEPLVILMDNHGWEVMRVPVSKTDVLRTYNSPMVEQYKWYSASVKTTGYHKYSVIGTPYHTSTSLATVPTGAKEGNDFYVTYTVKPAYTSTYTGAATAAATIPTAFLLKQGGKYAKTSGSIIEGADAPASIEDAPDDMLWFLRPNFDIDREMGYLYEGETGAHDEAKTKDATEQDYYIAGKNGFDPYNVQIQSKYKTNRYFTANSSAIALRSGVWTGTSSQVSLQNISVKQHATGNDQTTLNITNATFMVVSDANGNMRLMPRFDNTKVAEIDGDNNPFTVLAEQKAAAAAGDKGTNVQSLWLEHKDAATEIHNRSEITDMNGHYVLASDFTFAGFTSLGTSDAPFTGVIDGQYNTYSGLGTSLVAYANGAVIRNLILDNVSISGGDNVGAICNNATGATRIYNCGILATNSTVRTDENGYTHISSCSSSVSGSNYVGSIVGLLDGSSRVINCYSYADITGVAEVGGIVGHNNVATTNSDLRTMVMNCMYYGNIKNATNKAPIYNGENIINKFETGVGNYNYFYAEAPYVVAKDMKTSNGALMAETRFLQRFEFFRNLQNSHRELAAWWATGDRARKDEMAKWVLLPSQIGSSTPYPVLAKPGYYPSVVNIDAENATTTTERNKGGKMGTLTVNIQMGNGARFEKPAGAEIVYPSLTLNITDKDPEHFNFNYYKVQLPYYNEVGTKNYTHNRVVTGWKIVSITGGTPGSFTTGEDAPAYNFADRNCTNKDKYSVSGRVFSQGAYWDVPEGVTAITIEPYWAKASYLADANADVVYNTEMSTAYQVEKVGGGEIYTNGSEYSIAGNNQKVYTSLSEVVKSLSVNNSYTVNDYAVVLVGNYHYVVNSGVSDVKPYTVTSIDLDGDNEPDYSLMLRNNGRNAWHPVKWDFINIPGLGMAQKSTGGTGSYNLGIIQPKGWFETTNTSLFRVTQFEYEKSGVHGAAPYILQGGVMEQWVTGQNNGDTDPKNTTYFHVGGNVWFKEFHRGTHQDNTGNTNHTPISVTGGDFDKFYLTGMYRADVASYDDNAECYINGGRFGVVAGAAMEGIGNTSTHENGNITWQIQNADIKEFYGGGFNADAAHVVEGNITTTITGGKIDLFCGGPKFGDMNTGKTVTTTATGCEFGTFFGAGYGGSSYSRRAPTNKNNVMNIGWNDWLKTEYKQASATDLGFSGISTQFSYQFIPVSSNDKNVARIFIEHVLFSLATTHSVTSTLTGCTVTGNFYGGGSLGKVDGPATSTLTNCTVKGNVFGAGYSASLPTVEVDSLGFRVEPYYYEDYGTYRTGVKGATTTYEWQHGNEIDIDKTKHILYTTEDLTGLGAVTGKVTLTINGTTTVGESVYGGGEESAVNNDTEVNVNGGIIGTEGEGGARWGNVYGGGKGKADDVNGGLVKGNTTVNISGTAETTKILHNVYGGGAFGSVGTFTAFDAKGFPTALTANTGTTTVTITGGTFGSNGQNNGMVFGSSRGSEGDPEAEGSYVDKIAWVGNTNVVIGTTSAEDNTNPCIKGSVYGGGENGHNFKDALVTIRSGIIGIAEGSPITDDGGTPDDPSDDITYSGARYPSRGNVYGSGCGTDTYTGTDSKTYFDFNAGIVRGNTTVLIDGGHVVHNVYGGGAMGSVGTFTLDENGKPTSCAEGTGTCTVSVSGGQIGVAGAKMAGYGKGGPDDYGHVFGAGRGTMHDPVQYPNLETCAYFNKAILNISGSAFLTGSAYGGSESGHVLGDTKVNISGGQIGCGKNATEPYGPGVWDDDYVPSEDLECASWPYEAPYAPHDLYANATPPLDEYSNGKSTEGGRLEASDGHTYYGNVFGGGSGCVPYYDTTEGISKYLSTAGSVEGTATVTISGGHILTNVYGGCEATNVKGSATVTMTGGTVGVPRTFSQIVAHPVTCYVFGAGKGDQRISFNKETNVDHATVTVEGGKVYGSVFGGGEDGHVFQNTTVTIGKTGEEGPTIGTLGTSYVDGNVFGGGRGFSGDALTAGNVGGSVVLNIKSGKILGSVYGGGRLASVGYGLYLVNEEIEEDGQKIKPYGILRPDDKYDGSYPNPSTDPASTYYSNGRGYITINISGGTIGNDNEYIYNPTAEQKAEIPNTTFDYQNHLQYTKGGNVFTGGMGRLYALDGTLLPLWQKLGKCKETTLNMTGGTVKSSIYGGGEIGAVAENATVNINGGTVGTKVVDSEDATKYYYFGSVFGGGKGSVDNVDDISEAGTTGGNVEVHLNKTVASDDSKKGAIVHQVFGCNDMNGSPKGTVTVHVYATQNADKDNISSKYDKGTEKYDVEAVYGGGNLAAYIPTDDNSKASVTIDGCDLTSINTVYGGGNAASVPASEVIVKGTYEIGTIFGGGNGNDKLPSGEDNPGANVGYKADGTTTYGKGTTFVDLQGGLIHDAYGGSNAKGKIWKTASVSLNEAKDGESGEPCCPLVLDEVYGAGNEAYMEGGTSIDLVCISKLGTLYGGAKNADVNGNVVMNIQSGRFDRVFGGNNIGGNINGAIEVNIEETGCYPIIIGELYGGGNLAGYSVYGYNDDGTIKESGETPLYSDPTLNIKSFTSIGSIYGGGYGETAVMVGNPVVNINEVADPTSEAQTRSYTEDAQTKYYSDYAGETKTIAGHDVILPSHVSGKMGSIHSVFGGGKAAKVDGSTTVNIGNQSTIDFKSTTDVEAIPVTGADIRENVYGGGDEAEVTGDTNVVIGKKKE